jgi:RNA polymerase sigma-70 factor (ECF subfamily)
MAKNKCLNVLRKEKHKREHSQYVEQRRRLEIRLESLENSSLENLLHNDTMKVVMQTLEKMPPKTKEAFMLSRFSHKTYSEIASMQDISEKTVEYRISCALRLLRQAMGLLTIWLIVNLFK